MPSDKYIKQHTKLRKDLKDKVNTARNEFLYHRRMQAAYYLINLVTGWVKLKKTIIGMPDVDTYIWRITNGKRKEE